MQISNNYFKPLNSILNCQTKEIDFTVSNVLTILSYFTLIIPAFVYLYGRIKSLTPDSQDILLAKKILADGGNTDAQFEVGQIYRKQKNTDEAIRYLKLAIENNHVEACTEAGALCYTEGSIDEAVKFIEEAVERGSLKAKAILGAMYLTGEGVEEDKVKGFSLIKEASASALNNDEIFNDLAVCYKNGYGVQKNPQLALEYYKKAMEGGSIIAMYNLGNAYLNGEMGLEKNEVEAFKLYEKSAELGLGQAIYQLGYLHDRGIGVKENKEKAFSCFEKSAEKGDLQGIYALGLAFQFGYGVKKDLAKAKQYYQIASEKGSIDAKTRLTVDF